MGKNLYFLNKMDKIIDKLKNYDDNVLDEIFNNPDLTNIFLKVDNIKPLLLNYIITTKNKEFYEILSYFKNKADDNIINLLNSFYFLNGQFTNMDIKKLTESDEGVKMLNTILIYNSKPTTNETFNKIFDKIKSLDISSFKFDEVFNKILLNNIHNNYNFKFMDKYQQIKQETNISDLKLSHFIPASFEFKDLNIMDNLILKFNDDSKLFKEWFYILINYTTNKNINSIKELLNIFQNFNILNYYKMIYPNNKDSILITYLYFKTQENEYIPNLRYTVDIKGNNKNEKIKYLTNFKTQKSNDLTRGFKTTIESDDKGIYFKTSEYNTEHILKHCQDLINLKQYDILIYYIFNSQFLNRSTCLFGYFIYFHFTHRILKNNYYFDIIALTRPLEEFKKLINDNYIIHEPSEPIETLSLNDIVDMIK